MPSPPEGVVSAPGSASKPDAGCRAAEIKATGALLTEAEAEAHDAMLRRVPALSSFEEAMEGNGPVGVCVQWDFQQKRALPGRVWRDSVPDEWRQELERDYTPDESAAARRACGIDQAPSRASGERPRFVYIVGPPGAGKSSFLGKAAEILGLSLESFVSIDGDDLRSCHANWVRRIDEDPHLGYQDSFKVFKRAQQKWRGKYSTLKLELAVEAQRSRKDVLVCDTKLDPTVQQHIVEQDYEVITIGFVTSQPVSDMRNRNRGQSNGRYGDASPAAWRVAMNAIKFLTEPGRSSRAVVFDTTEFAAPKTLYTDPCHRQALEAAIASYEAALLP